VSLPSNAFKVDAIPLPLPQMEDNSIKSHGLNMWWGGGLLALWVIVLIITVVVTPTLDDPPQPLLWWEVFYRTGSIIYGGGQVGDVVEGVEVEEEEEEVLHYIDNSVVVFRREAGKSLKVLFPNPRASIFRKMARLGLLHLLFEIYNYPISKL